jgi:ubiquinone/menaquinone biosynthesis C-methylase UbiE
MSIQRGYDNWSGTYDSDNNLTRDLDQVVTRDTLVKLKSKSVIEIGCGTGKNTVLLSQMCQKVHAIDFSEGMIQKAKEKVQLDNVNFSVADITKPWDFADISVDLVTCNLVLEHIEDLSFIFSEVFRSLIDGGYFFISELHPFKQYQGTKANFQRNQDTIEIPAFIHHASDFFNVAINKGFTLKEFNEWWHEKDENRPPRLISFLFKK